MINLDDAYIRAYLRDIDQRVTNAAETLEWIDGNPTLNPAELLPGFDNTNAPDESAIAFQRLAQQVQSLAPRAFRQRRTGTIGNVNWGGTTTGEDARLRLVNLDDLARRAHKSLFTQGIAAVWPYRPEGQTEVKLQALGGYLEPLYDPDDPAGEPVALYQVLANPQAEGTKQWYRVRIYDFAERTVRQWNGVSKPWAIASAPDDEWTDQDPPAFVTTDVDQDGRPVGVAQTLLPLFKQELAAQMRIIRNSNTHAFGMYAFTGDWALPEYFGPTQVLMGTGDAGNPATAARLQPGDLGPLFEERDRIEERIRSDSSLPISTLTGGNFPSGEAITQANQAYISACQGDAGLLSDLLSRGVQMMTGDEGILVTVSINREALRSRVMMDARENYREGIVSLRAAGTAISPYYPDTTDVEWEAFWERDEQPLDVNAFLPSVPTPGDDGEE